MERLFIFLYQYRAFVTFLVLELICAWMIIENNHYQGARFFNSSTGVVASLNSFSHGMREYFMLRKINNTLAEENAYLRSQLEAHNQRQDVAQSIIALDSIVIPKLDSAVIHQFDFVSAKVVNNTINRFTNYLTINKGYHDNISPGMGVISPSGIVGKVKTVSKHYSVVTSVLHKDVRISVILKRTKDFCSAQWDGTNPDYIKLDFVPRHVKPVKGDTVVTSGYSSVYPAGIMVGVIDDIRTDETLFYDLTVKLSQDFRKISYVEIVRNQLKHELDSLQEPFVEENER
jgi:rod shape-determining protein MreC